MTEAAWWKREEAHKKEVVCKKAEAKCEYRSHKKCRSNIGLKDRLWK